MNKPTLEDLTSLAKRRGFIYQGSDIYGGLSGTWDYGPLGVTLKRNIMQLWWKTFVDDRDDMYGVDAAILMNQKVWQASGHATGFTDPVTVDTVTKKSYRADHLLKTVGINPVGMDLADMTNTIFKHDIRSPEGNSLSPVASYNMMFQTYSGASSVTVEVEDIQSIKGKIVFTDAKGKTLGLDVEQREDMDSLTLFRRNERVYLRPETAQGIFTNYKNIIDSFYPDLPFGLAQQGKAFRNEISPRDFVFRSREFEQMEVEYFVHESQWQEAFEKWRTDIQAFLKTLGLPEDKVHELEVPAEDLAHYSKRTIDFEFDFPHGRDELLGLAYRTDFDLGNIERESGKSMAYRPKDGSEPFVPHVIEPSFGVERAMMAVLTSAYCEDEVNGEKRVFLRLPKHLAPIKAAVSPLLKNKPELVAKAREVYRVLQKQLGNVMWDDNGNIGKRYRRQDEIGTPNCITIDFQTLDDDTVTIRDRDTAEQRRVQIDKLLAEL